MTKRLSRGLLLAFLEQIWTEQAQIHQPRLRDSVAPPLRNRLGGDLTETCNLSRPTEFVDKGIRVHTGIKANLTYVRQGYLTRSNVTWPA